MALQHRFDRPRYEKFKDLKDTEKGLLVLAVLLRGLGREVIEQTAVAGNDFTNKEKAANTMLNNYLDTHQV